jgi:DNA modification methylase
VSFIEAEGVRVYHGDCIEVMRTLPENSIDAIVTDPPYGLEFMGKDWDAPWKQAGDVIADPATVGGFQDGAGGNPFSRSRIRYGREDGASVGFQLWFTDVATEALRVLKPGGHLLAFGGTRTWHRLAVAIEDAGFEVRDSICWLYASGFPKSLNASKALVGNRCQCDVGQYEDGKQTSEHNLPRVRFGHVSETLGVEGGQGSLLLTSLSKPSAPVTRWSEPSDSSARSSKPRMEGRGDLQAPEGELHRPALREVPAGVSVNGARGRLRDGAPASYGQDGGKAFVADGSGQSHKPQSTGQSTGESRTVPKQRGSQAWRGWPICQRCGKQEIPDGLGTALKPAHEPIVVARKPLIGTVAENVLTHGTGALNIDGCRIAASDQFGGGAKATSGFVNGYANDGWQAGSPAGRWPANVILDESQAAELDAQSGKVGGSGGQFGDRTIYNANAASYTAPEQFGYNDSGGASRFFYVAKAGKKERPNVDGVAHPTVKPISLMRYLVRLVTPPGGTVLEPFAGSGTTVEACILEGFDCIAIEMTDDYLPLIAERVRRSTEDKEGRLL